MKNLNTFSISLFFFFAITQISYAQMVAIVGYNGSTGDGYTIVALETIPGDTKIYFTDKSYSDISNAFLQDEGYWSYTAPAGGHAIGDVITFEETGTSTNVLTVACNGGNCGSFLNDSGGSISLASSTAEGVYAYSDADNDPTNGVNSIHAVLYSKGVIPTDEDPGIDFPDAVVVHGFSLLGDHRQFTVALRSGSVTLADLENPSNYDSPTADGNTTLSTVPFTNIILAELTATVTASPSTLTCFGDENGSILVEPTGGFPDYTYTWDNVLATGNNPINLPAGTYCVTVTDMTGNTFNTCTSITEPVALGSTVEVTSIYNSDISCFGASDGEATVTASGGTGGYSYLWSNGDITATATSLNEGIHFVTVTDANGCTTSNGVILTSPAEVGSAIIAQTNVECNGGNTGFALAQGFGGVGGISFLWSNGDNTSVATSLSSGVYFLTVTDLNGCQATSSVNITEPTALEAAFSSTSETNSNMDGTAIANMSGGTPGYNYSWNTNPVQTTNPATGLSAGTYTVTVTDANGCEITGSIEVTQLLFSAPSNLCINSEILMGLSGGIPSGGMYSGPGVTDDGNGMTYSFDPVSAGNGTHAITYTLGAVSATGDIEVFEVPMVTLSFPDTVAFNGGVPPTGLSGGSPAGGVYSDFYNEITDGGNGMTFSFDTLVLGFNSITYTYTDQNGCTGTASQDIEVVILVGVDEPETLKVEIFPNPTTGIIELRGTKADRIEIIDTFGRRLLKDEKPTSAIDISDFPDGLYFLKISSGKYIVTRRVVKK